jgi:ATP-dependent Clp endopeptidase proteolytic subunit ClpP
MKTWYSLAQNAPAGRVRVYLTDMIGGWGISGRQFIDDLKKAITAPTDVVELVINSPGGSCVEGIFIFNELRQLANEIECEVSGMAASMASVILMAGDVRRIHANSLVMIHNPWTQTAGDADELRKNADLLDLIKKQIVSAYRLHSGATEEEISAMMDAETWLDGQAAVDNGFCTECLAIQDMAACVKFDAHGLGKIPDNAKQFFQEATANEVQQPDQPAADGAAVAAGAGAGDVPAAVATAAPAAVPSADDRYAAGLAEGRQHGEEIGTTKLAAVTAELKHSQGELAKAQKVTSELQAQLADKQKVITQLQSARDISQAELADMKQRFGRLTVAMDFDPDTESGLTWAEALNRCGGDYVKARTTHPAAYRDFMRQANKKHNEKTK